jgi:hypothetical protein
MARMTLEELARQLAQIYGAELHAVAVYGSTVIGETIPRLSDTNVLVLVETLDLERLTRESATARAWAAGRNPPPLTLTLHEWRRSADVFPMEYADILEGHRMLHGEALPLEGIRVARRNLRLQLEQQALGKLLKLRQGILSAGPDPRARLVLLSASLSTFMVLFRSAARLTGERAPRDYDALIRRVADLAGFTAEPFLRVLEHVRGRNKLALREVKPVLQGYLAGVQQLVSYVDQFGEPPSIQEEVRP